MTLEEIKKICEEMVDSAWDIVIEGTLEDPASHVLNHNHQYQVGRGWASWDSWYIENTDPSEDALGKVEYRQMLTVLIGLSLKAEEDG